MYIQKNQIMDPVMVHSYSAGDIFGELALLYNAPRAATVKVSLHLYNGSCNNHTSFSNYIVVLIMKMAKRLYK
jgi:hypothetical protein